MRPSVIAKCESSEGVKQHKLQAFRRTNWSEGNLLSRLSMLEPCQQYGQGCARGAHERVWSRTGLVARRGISKWIDESHGVLDGLYVHCLKSGLVYVCLPKQSSIVSTSQYHAGGRAHSQIYCLVNGGHWYWSLARLQLRHITGVPLCHAFCESISHACCDCYVLFNSVSSPGHCHCR